MYTNRNNEFDVAALFTRDYGAEFYLRQISRMARMPLKTCQNALSSLEKARLLKSTIEGKNKYFSLNTDNIMSKYLVLQAELHQTKRFLEKYPAVKMFLKHVGTNEPMIVFGSFARLMADKDSDLDLLIISESELKMPFHLLPYKIHQIILSEKSFEKAIKTAEPLIKEMEKNHIIINNHSFYVNMMWSNHVTRKN